MGVAMDMEMGKWKCNDRIRMTMDKDNTKTTRA